MEPIPRRARERIITLYDEGVPTQEIAEVTGCSKAGVRRVRQRFRERGTIEPKAGQVGPKGKFTPEVQGQLRALVAERADRTLAELRAAMRDRHGVDAAVSTVDRWLARLELALKKSR